MEYQIILPEIIGDEWQNIGIDFGPQMITGVIKGENIDKPIINLKNYAIYLANNPKELEKIKKKLILSVKNSNTFNTKLYTKNLEKAYKLVQDRYYKKLTTEDIYLN